MSTADDVSTAGRDVPGVAVVVCVHTPSRLALIRYCLAAVSRQLDRGRDELVVVVDHDEALERTLRAEQPGARVVPNRGARGLSDARNTGIATSSAPVVVFLDDDAVPRPGWLRAWRRVFADPDVMMGGGAVVPRWSAGRAPRWFPDEFGWVVGCDYRGMAASGSPIRNPIGANMAVRRRALERVGRFSVGLGRVGRVPTGCEETELGIRVGRAFGPGSVVRDTGPVVDHQVPVQRGRLAYFVSRCHHEGRSKAVLTAAVGADDSLSAERTYVLRSLTAGFLRHAAALARADLAGPLRSAALALGLLATVSGFLLGRRRAVPGPSAPAVSNGAYRPIPVVDVELADTRGAPPVATELPASVLVRFQGLPVGSVLLRPDAAGAAEAFDRAVCAELAPALRWHLGRAGVDVAATATPEEILAAARAQPRRPIDPPCSGDDVETGDVLVTVVVCTLGTEPRLRALLDSVLAQTHRRLEVVVVDNDPRSGRLEHHLAGIDDPRLRVVPEPVRGLSSARNTGLAAAAGQIVAFTDDDASPDPRWVAELVRVFELDRDGAIGCVTGLVTPARLETRWELYFEEYGGFDKGYVPRIWSLRPVPPAVLALAEPGQRGPLFPHAGGNYGSGNNMAFRTGALRAAGGFDVALGAGSPTRGGEDLDAFRVALEAGHAVFYTPSALVRHFHRNSEGELRRQMYGYGAGMAAIVFKQVISGPTAAAAVLCAVPSALNTLLSPRSPKNVRKSAEFPAVLTVIELLGYLAGPWLLLRSRREVRRRAAARLRRSV